MYLKHQRGNTQQQKQNKQLQKNTGNSYRSTKTLRYRPRILQVVHSYYWSLPLTLFG